MITTTVKITRKGIRDSAKRSPTKTPFYEQREEAIICFVMVTADDVMFVMCAH